MGTTTLHLAAAEELGRVLVAGQGLALPQQAGVVGLALVLVQRVVVQMGWVPS